MNVFSLDLMSYKTVSITHINIHLDNLFKCAQKLQSTIRLQSIL